MFAKAIASALVIAVAAVAVVFFVLRSNAPESLTPIFQAECRDGYQWSAFTVEQGGLATFDACGSEEPYISMLCRTDSDEVVMEVNRRFVSLADGEPVSAVMTIGESDFPLKGAARFDEALGGVAVIMTPGKNDPVFVALTRSGDGKLVVAGEQVPFSTFGSFHPIVKMMEACD